MGALAVALACLALVGAGVAVTAVLRQRQGVTSGQPLVSRPPCGPVPPQQQPTALAVVDGTVYVACGDRIMTFAVGTLEKLAETAYAAPIALPAGGDGAAAVEDAVAPPPPPTGE
jgi:hypothetical protein